jgi:chromosome segregation ATPase
VQNAFRHEQQVARTRDEETRGQNLLRSGQLERQRELLDERQQSIERERQVLSKERRALEERLSVDSENLRREQAAWELDRDTQKADLRRQQDMLALHAENLETRRQRLDRLRAELEETNRQTLELRLAVEESAAQLMQTAGSEVTQQRIDEARAVLAEYYRHTRESLIRQHQELEQAQVRIEEQREGFRTERQTLVEWVTQQEAQLAAREQAQRAERAALAQRDAELRTAVELMTAEKLQSESTIRDLLQQLSAREAGSEKT